MSSSQILLSQFPGPNGPIKLLTLIDNGDGTETLWLSDLKNLSDYVSKSDPAAIVVPEGAVQVVSAGGSLVVPPNLPLDITGRSTALASTILLTPTESGLYLIDEYMSITTAGTGSGSTLQSTYGYADENGVQTISPHAALSQVAVGSIGGQSVIFAVAGTPITVSTAYASSSANAHYSLHTRIQRLG